ncbi:MAG: hemerythrin family protein [candidate division Zixibacteria bacterium]|nr:hemerythrin family protein [candidate division Zixibacteria bacterium]
MSKFKKYHIGIPEMDSQHEKLLSNIDKLRNSIIAKDTAVQINDSISEMMHYVKVHFTAEESLLKKAGYPGFDNHVLKHRQFIKKVVEYHKRTSAGTTPSKYELISFLQEWANNHILTDDKKYAEYIINMVEVKSG